MPTPTDERLYARTKRAVYAQNPVHSAYRSATLVRRYKAAFANKHGSRKRPYTGSGKPAPGDDGLTRWFKENWKSDTGRYRYTSKSSVYRPTVRVTRKTPKTFAELTPRELARAKREKRVKGRVKKF